MNKTVFILIAAALSCGQALAEPATYKIDDVHTYVTFAVDQHPTMRFVSGSMVF